MFFEDKTRDKYVCRGQMISLNAEMARVANVERGNFVCENQTIFAPTLCQAIPTDSVQPRASLRRKLSDSIFTLRRFKL